MTRPYATLILFLAIAPLLAGCEDECAPDDFGGGNECSGEVGLYKSCRLNECREGPFCNERWVIDEQHCPSTAHQCVQVNVSEVACIGEIVGPCNSQGFVRCEDALTTIYCGDNGFGALALQRGICAAGARCYEQSERLLDTEVGCQPAY